jgi:mannose-6-phosphate isomerase-like protein (cupin superfamily)
MTYPAQTPAPRPAALLVAVGADRFGVQRGLGISAITFKVTPQDSDGLLILENTFHAKGGPPRHLHYEQDEWFYAVEGEFLIEVGDDRMTLRPGDAVLAPLGDQGGRMLIAFMPAGQMGAFFRVVTAADAMPPQEPDLWRAHGMELLGPPLAVE